MNYQTFAPPDMLRPFVKYFWTMEVRPVDHAPKTFSAIVDGCPGVIIVQSENEPFCDEHQKKLPTSFLYGQTIRPVQLSSTGKFAAIGICFQPHALQSVFGIDADELTGSCVDLNLVSNKKHNSLPELLFDTESVDERIKRLSCYLFDLVQSNKKRVDEITQYALMQIVQTSGNIPLKELQQKLQLSERSLERRFKQTIGVSPKLYTRICQFQKSLDQLRKSQYDKLSDIAYENDYSDQSHFIRVFKEFTGLSPFEFKKQSKEVVENLTQIAR
jgi:AraC-like DNA-binding protein